MTVTSAFVPFLTAEEGFSETWYWDVKGYSIGYGFFEATLREVTGLHRGNLQHLTRARADSIYRDLMEKRFEPCVRAGLTREIHPLMYEACLSFAYNLGCGNWQRSTLRRKINQGDFEGAAREFTKWANPARRAREAERFREGMRLMNAATDGGTTIRPWPGYTVEIPDDVDLGPDTLDLPGGFDLASAPKWLWLLLLPAGYYALRQRGEG